MNRRVWLMSAVLLVCSAQAVLAAQISVLSAGAIEPGIRPALAAFEKASGRSIVLTFATAPQIRQRIGAGESFDVVIAPPAVLDELEKAAKVGAERAAIGRVGIGVAVRPGAVLPDISNAEAVKRAVLEADSLVFNRASTGLYFESLLKKMGLDAQALPKSTRYADGASVMEHVLHGKGHEIGFGAITEIVLLRGKGLQLVGPLPPELQNLTAYAATPMKGQPTGDVQALMRHLASAETRAGFAAAGIDQGP
ncbi:MAG: substrate-binding domain-containing protein [Burkholderiaceae bacterium]